MTQRWVDILCCSSLCDLKCARKKTREAKHKPSRLLLNRMMEYQTNVNKCFPLDGSDDAAAHMTRPLSPAIDPKLAKSLRMRPSRCYSLRDALKLWGRYQIHLLDKSSAGLFSDLWFCWLDSSSAFLGVGSFVLAASLQKHSRVGHLETRGELPVV